MFSFVIAHVTPMTFVLYIVMFVLYIAANVTMEMLMGLDFGQNGAGMENVLMWYFEKRMGYRLLNPCKIVYVYHNHCVPVKLVQYTR